MTSFFSSSIAVVSAAVLLIILAICITYLVATGKIRNFKLKNSEINFTDLNALRKKSEDENSAGSAETEGMQSLRLVLLRQYLYTKEYSKHFEGLADAFCKVAWKKAKDIKPYPNLKRLGLAKDMYNDFLSHKELHTVINWDNPKYNAPGTPMDYYRRKLQEGSGFFDSFNDNNELNQHIESRIRGEVDSEGNKVEPKDLEYLTDISKVLVEGIDFYEQVRTRITNSFTYYILDAIRDTLTEWWLRNDIPITVTQLNTYLSVHSENLKNVLNSACKEIFPDYVDSWFEDALAITNDGHRHIEEYIDDSLREYIRGLQIIRFNKDIFTKE